MTGLDTIVEQILQEGQKAADDIKTQADKEVQAIIANAEKTVEKMNAATADKVEMTAKSGQFRAQSSAELKKRQAVLLAKQGIIKDIMDKAYNRMIGLPDEEYFEIIMTCLKAAALPKKGMIIFNAKDQDRLTFAMKQEIKKIAKERGGELDIADTSSDIEGGFILSYGGIEENCSFKAMFDANKESLADKVNQFLFVESK